MMMMMMMTFDVSGDMVIMYRILHAKISYELAAHETTVYQYKMLTVNTC